MLNAINKAIYNYQVTIKHYGSKRWRKEILEIRYFETVGQCLTVFMHCIGLGWDEGVLTAKDMTVVSSTIDNELLTL